MKIVTHRHSYSQFLLILGFLLITRVSLFSQSLYYPPLTGDTWDTISSASLGWHVQEIDNLINFLDEKETKAFLILIDGKIAIEHYFDSFTQQSIWYWASAAKTLTTFLVGLAQEDGFLSTEDSTAKYLGQGWTDCPPDKEALIKIKHHLSMTTGLDDSVPDNHCTLDTCLIYKADAGTRWAYHNAPNTLLHDVVSIATGLTYNNYTNTRLKNQTGMDGFWLQNGYNEGYYSTARSMARFGLLVLGNGIWDGDIVMSDIEYFHQMINTSQDLNLSYGYMWWLNGKFTYMAPESQIIFPGPLIPKAPMDMVAGLGKNDQKVYVIPSLNMVVVRMGNDAGNPFLGEASFDNELWGYINNVISPDEYQKGHTTINFIDPSRNNRDIPTEIYYPSNNSGEDVSVASGMFPVLSFGHGYLMPVDTYENFRDFFVPKGYIMVFPDTETGILPNALDLGLDMSFLINSMAEENLDPGSIFYGAIAPESALLGHSMGGGASMLAAANERSITAVANFAASNTTPSAIDAASEITIPALLFSGSEDCVTLPSETQDIMYDSLASECKTQVTITGGGHCYFGNYSLACAIGENACEPDLTINRTEQQDVTFDFLLLWLNNFLKGDSLLYNTFLDSLHNSQRITYRLDCNLPVYEEQLVDIPAGWSGMSSWIVPYYSDSLTAIFDPISDTLVILMDLYNIYWPSEDINTIGLWNPIYGYKVKVTEDVSVSFFGTRMMNRVMQLYAGWHIIPVLAHDPVSTMETGILSDLGDTLTIAFDIAGTGVYWPAEAIYTLTHLIPGKAYMVHVVDTCSINFEGMNRGSSSSSSSEMGRSASNYTAGDWNEVYETGSSHVVALDMEVIQKLEKGDIIGGFTTNNVCSGIVSINDLNSPNALVLFGNDITTVERHDGFLEMENITLRLYRSSTGDEFNFIPEYDPALIQHDGKYYSNGLSAIRNFLLTPASTPSNRLSDQILIYPNPAHQRLFIKIEESQLKPVAADIFNIDGQIKIQTTLLSGLNVIPISTLEPGVYVIRLLFDKSVVYRRVVVY